MTTRHHPPPPADATLSSAMLLERPTTWLCLALALSAGAGSIKPAFKWAQSPSDIHIYAKFAHKVN
eukprot:426337-Amorphochlora_amoeboformis.AAC.1